MMATHSKWHTRHESSKQPAPEGLKAVPRRVVVRGSLDLSNICHEIHVFGPDDRTGVY